MMHSAAPYKRRAYYYETDKMGIVHHSNYIRWFEEARLDSMGQTGLNYGSMEKTGIIMPVTNVSCRYIVSVRFDEEVEIFTKLSYFDGIRAAYSYEIYKDGGILAACGESGHCFLDEITRMPVSLKKKYPDFYEEGLSLVEGRTI